ncbi:hypothetical protein EG346_19385 [Chryseobacterium carnipullorum]|uniref:Uncharacterized protein n=1 Tax=Chryseobacterium carnipullorum TaxID=1124835 RepID=A0A1M7IL18_CHRCU|nr:hypothetical protein [Chryseobacterium carnipullorum]AZA50206.1 hypothetical protein EG346_19385 [Chryseobacterium carnipullorum]AZA65077.1 hypothetical protein EG345_10425 [Chryseobacterium carnipullorum]SHM41506.1 hypothetical protein SAMN05444360_111175 [Chryseobacterium carnipullorum]STC97780.1 Uncharacterised protein [Chryseobacterium carnipullorum]HBV14469.1 hypothetical protein [Chryseobacterium carnipullorum]
MIFENDTLKYSGLNDKNNMIENESLFPSVINSYGVTAFLIKSLEKIKNNAQCDILKNVMDTYIKDYILNIREYHGEKTSSPSHRGAEIKIENSSFTLYAKTAYYKVLKEEEYLNKLLNTLEKDRTNPE